MTKQRAPATIENALFTVLGAIGIDKAVEITGREANYLRSMSDPDSRYHLSVDDACKLDLAHQEAGYAGAPIYEAYGIMLDQAHAERFSDQAELANSACDVVKESSDAVGALIRASRPGATEREEAEAARELEQLVNAARAPLARLAKRRGPVEAPP